MKKMNLSAIKQIALFLLFLILCLGIYSNTLEVPFYFDDVPRISDNPDIRMTKMTFNKVRNAAFGEHSASNRPFGNITFALNYYFHKYDLKGYHVVNIIIHTLTGIFLYLFIKTTLSVATPRSPKPSIPESLDPSFPAFFAALVWLAHPVHTQSVTYIVQRFNSMAAMFYVLSFWLYVKGRIRMRQHATQNPQSKAAFSPKSRKSAISFLFSASSLYFSGSVMAWIIALGSKQTAATLPFFIFLYEWYFFQDLSRDWLKCQLKYCFGIIILFGLICLIYTGLNPLKKIVSSASYARNNFIFTERVLTQPRVVIYYLSLLFYPHPSRLNLDYDFPLSHSLIDPVTTLLSLLTIIGIVGLAVYAARRERLISFCILWYFGNLVIESSVIPLAIIFEHRTYLPSMLICLLVVALGHRLIKFKWLGITFMLVVVTVFSFWTYQRNKVWRDDITLWQDVVNKSPQKVRPHNNLGNALIESGRTEEAIEHYLQALRINPYSSEVHNNLADALSKLGQFQKAIDHYHEALRIQPDYVDAYNDLGNALINIGQVSDAIRHFNQALRLNPKFVPAYNSLSLALIRMGKTDEAVVQLQKALKINPNYVDAHVNLGGVLIGMGKNDQAVAHLRKALQITSDISKAHMNLGIALANTGQIENAVAHLRQALQLDPVNAEAQHNLNNILATLEKIDRKISNLQAELILAPEDPVLHFDLGNMSKMKGQLDTAEDYYRKAIALQPVFPEALYELAKLYISRQEYEKALDLYDKTLTYLPDNPAVDYNIACIYAKQNKPEESVAWLTKAVAKGLNDWEHIKADRDLDNIRNSLQYKEFVKGH